MIFFQQYSSSCNPHKSLKGFILKVLLFFILVPSQLAASSRNLQLLDKLQEAQVGDYVVIKQSFDYKLIAIHKKTNTELQLLECTVPPQKIQEKISWNQWMDKGAPGNTSLILYEVEFESGKIIEAFHVSRSTFLNLNEHNNFVEKLLTIPFTKLPLQERKKIGPRPHLIKDTRPLWQPLLIFQGKKIPNVSFEAYKSKWPHDQSELANQEITIYLPIGEGKYPCYLPYWLELGSKITKAKMRIVDSGNNLNTQKFQMPKQAPQFLNNGEFINSNLAFLVKSPPYFKEFFFLAIDKEESSSSSLLLPAQIKPLDTPNTLEVSIPMGVIKKLLKNNRAYFFLLVPKNDEDNYAKSQRPILIRF